MKKISCELITRTVCELFLRANSFLPAELSALLENAASAETHPLAKRALGLISENSRAAREKELPLCQDTGMAVVFAELGREVALTGGAFADAVNAGVAQAYEKGCFRRSVVTPLTRINTGDNTPAVIHTELVEGDSLRLVCVPKGFGSENMSRIAMLSPTAERSEIIDFVRESVISAGGRPCPPLVLGVGIGGTFEYAALLAKKALAFGGDGSEETNALETEILGAVNSTGVGAQGFGGDITALAVCVRTFPTHIASLPVAVNFSCHASRRAEAVL